MTESFNLDPVARITAGAVGEPGERIFYLQAKQGALLVSLLVEKTQVAALARSIDALLSRLERIVPGSSEDAPAAELDLEQPLEPSFRVGQMSLGYDRDRDLVLLQCDEFAVPSDEDDPESVEEMTESFEDPAEGATARFWATRGQMRLLAKHGTEVVSAGRPLCRLCGLPLDPLVQHICPAMNGHRERGTES